MSIPPRATPQDEKKIELAYAQLVYRLGYFYEVIESKNLFKITVAPFRRNDTEAIFIEGDEFNITTGVIKKGVRLRTDSVQPIKISDRIVQESGLAQIESTVTTLSSREVQEIMEQTFDRVIDSFLSGSKLPKNIWTSLFDAENITHIDRP